MSVKTLTRADRPTTKAWVSKLNAKIDVTSIEDLHRTFCNRLHVTRGQQGETIIACQPQDSLRLDKIMETSDLFSRQTIYADLEDA